MFGADFAASGEQSGEGFIRLDGPRWAAPEEEDAPEVFGGLEPLGAIQVDASKGDIGEEISEE